MNGLRGKRVLIAEDDPMLGWELEELLSREGCIVIGPFAELSTLMETLGGASFDAAVLDVTIVGGLVFPAADVLARARIPYLFLSGHGLQMIPERHRKHPLVNKPFVETDLLDTLKRSLNLPAAA